MECLRVVQPQDETITDDDYYAASPVYYWRFQMLEMVKSKNIEANEVATIKAIYQVEN